jgi:hypothetical protein
LVIYSKLVKSTEIMELIKKPRPKPPNAGKGRPVGVPNKSTAKAREAFAIFVDNNSEKMQEWLEAIANDPKHGPKVAFDCLMAVSEYHVPKLSRSEMVGEGGGPMTVEIVRFGEQSTDS